MSKEKFPHVNKGNWYAREVVKGNIPACTYVIMACQRHLDDLAASGPKDYPYRFDRKKAERVLRFAELMPHVKGKWKGTQLILQPWQCFSLMVPFGWVRKSTGLRRFREMQIFVPRKNGKSVLGAVIGNYLFVADGEPSSEVYSSATKESQSMEVFRPAWLMANKARGLKEKFDVSFGGSMKNPKNMFSMKSESRFETVVGDPGDGSSPHGWIQDEFHEAKRSNAYDTGKTGMGAREQPMMVVITTSGMNTSYPCYSMFQMAKKVLAGQMENDELFAMIYTIDPEDDWEDFGVWEKANPNIDVSVNRDFLHSQWRSALQDPRVQNKVKCKHLNMWSNAGAAWINEVSWGKCHDRGMALSDFYGEPAFIGIDLASKIDIAAKIYLFVRDEEYYMFSRYYIPESRTEEESCAHYKEWVEMNYMEYRPGSRIDLQHIENSLKMDAKLFDLSGEENGGGEVCNDPWNAQQMVTNLINEGVACVEITQNPSTLNEPMREIEAAIKEGKFHHDGSPVTAWMMGNVVKKTTLKDLDYPTKDGADNKIDGAVGLINAMSRAMYTLLGEKSVYDNRGILTF